MGWLPHALLSSQLIKHLSERCFSQKGANGNWHLKKTPRHQKLETLQNIQVPPVLKKRRGQSKRKTTPQKMRRHASCRCLINSSNSHQTAHSLIGSYYEGHIIRVILWGPDRYGRPDKNIEKEWEKYWEKEWEKYWEKEWEK